MLDVLGLAGSVQTAQLMSCLLRRSTADALLLFDQLYRGGKDVAALLNEQDGKTFPCGTDGSGNAGQSTADNDQIIFFHMYHLCYYYKG